jgi:hypothetical protein
VIKQNGIDSKDKYYSCCLMKTVEVPDNSGKYYCVILPRK